MPLVTLLLVAANVLAYLLELEAGGQTACEAYGLTAAHLSRPSEVGHLVTSLFLHDPKNLLHIATNMAFLTVFGTFVERALGGFRLASLYFAAGIFGGLMHVMVDPTATDPLVGASGAIYGVMAVTAVIRPRLLGFVIALGAVNVWRAFMGGEDGVSFGAHLGGLAAGVIVGMMLKAVDRFGSESTAS